MSDKRFLYTFAFVCVSFILWAMPAKRGAITVSQPDGTTLTVFNHGDEHFHYLTDSQGRWLRQEPDGQYVEIPALSDEEITLQRNKSPKLKCQQQRLQQAYDDLPRNIAEHGIIILVNFQDLEFKKANTLASMQEMHSGENYTYNGATGSCRQYFYDQSMGKYNPQFDVVGPVTLPQTMRYYGTNLSNGDDQNAAQMIYDACQLADSVCGVDFSQYDNDGDKYVDFVYVLYAGYSEAEGAPSYTMWPHAWAIESGGYRLTLDGVKINNYACGSELQGTSGSRRAGIGTFCHEFSHILGLPDFYPTVNASHKTLGTWDIMDYGPYNNDTRTPPSYSAYERFFMGWMKPEYISKPANLTLNDIQTSNHAYIVTTSQTPNMNGLNPTPSEFYLLENRQQTSWDTYLPGHGMMITKVSFNHDKWMYNTVNNNSASMGMDIIEAAARNKYDTNDYPTDLFPAGATEYKGIANRSITDIKENNSVISFKFMGGSIVDDLSFNYAQALYDSTYNSSKGYSWEINLYNLIYNEARQTYEYDARLFFSIYTKKRYALSGSYQLSQMDYAELHKITDQGTEKIAFTSCNVLITYLGKDSEGYDKYKIEIQATDENNVKYDITEYMSVYCSDYITNESLYMVDEISTDQPQLPDNGTVNFNYAQALYSPSDNRNNKCFWEVQLFNITDYSTRDYDALLFFSILTQSDKSISGNYAIEDMDYAYLLFTGTTDTTRLALTSGEVSIRFVKNDINGYCVYDLTVEAMADNGKKYTVSQRLSIYCWNLYNNTEIAMDESIISDVQPILSDSDIVLHDGMITVQVPADVQIYSLSGHLLYRNHSDGHLTIQGLPRNQLMIVVVGQKAQKIVL